ncbi:hypothetical protein U8527_04645 [Kordia algicida OT-1]|uniref:hypothetical protein n=1 Tax=Kordia algicida TaxID=221066 RepID=UPI0012F83742|nr:hypothetical protein [Kordia algicida]
MKYITYVFFYARELLVLSIFLTVMYVVCHLSGLSILPFVIVAKLILPMVFFITKKMNDHSTLYFLYNLGMRNRTILLLLYFFTTVDVFLLQFILS